MDSSSIGAWVLPLGAGPEEPANSHGKSLMVRVACLPFPWALACLSVIKMVPCSAMWISTHKPHPRLDLPDCQGRPFHRVQELLDFILGARNRRVLDVIVGLDIESIRGSILWFPGWLPSLLQPHIILGLDKDACPSLVPD